MSRRKKSESEYEPLYDYVVIEPFEEDETITPGGLIVPTQAKPKPQIGRVLAVGHGRLKEDGEFISLAIEEGEVVLFNKYAGTEIETEVEEGQPRKSIIIIREGDILAVKRL